MRSVWGIYLTIAHEHEIFSNTISLTASPIPILGTIQMNEMRGAEEFRAQLKIYSARATAN